jgi:hypothetical protein
MTRLLEIRKPVEYARSGRPEVATRAGNFYLDSIQPIELKGN